MVVFVLALSARDGAKEEWSAERDADVDVSVGNQRQQE